MDFDIDDFVVNDRDTINAATLDFAWKHPSLKGIETMATNIRFTCVPILDESTRTKQKLMEERIKKYSR